MNTVAQTPASYISIILIHMCWSAFISWLINEYYADTFIWTLLLSLHKNTWYCWLTSSILAHVCQPGSVLSAESSELNDQFLDWQAEIRLTLLLLLVLFTEIENEMRKCQQFMRNQGHFSQGATALVYTHTSIKDISLHQSLRIRCSSTSGECPTEQPTV